MLGFHLDKLTGIDYPHDTDGSFTFDSAGNMLTSKDPYLNTPLICNS